MTDEPMTKAERDELAKLVRRREKLAKAQAAQRSAELLAQFEEQLDARYSYDQDEVWAAANAAAEKAIADADAQVAERCRDLGIPDQFRPRISGAMWFNRGENAFRERRAELRRLATVRIAALEKTAKAEIESRSVEVQTELVAGGLQSAEARAFLEAMPTAEALMPVLNLPDIEERLQLTRGRR
jgi:hypothetical protein